MIDEYQDTNKPQYLLAKLLAASHRNLCVVGDDDQSIYGWRGADLNNILDFEKDYPDALVIRLEQNYRSTQVILDAGNAVIAHNQGRKGKRLWTESTGGEKIRVLTCSDEQDEAARLAGAIRDLKVGNRHRNRDIAILYRTNAQSRAIEEGLRREAIPYVIVGGLRFYQRKEVKDILGYLRVLANPADSVSLFRILNTPKRGIGDTSVQHLADFAAREAISPYEGLGRLDEIPAIRVGARKAMIRFHAMMETFRASVGVVPLDKLGAEIVEAIKYRDELTQLPIEEAESRRDVVDELLVGLEEFAEREEDASLDAFLEQVSLVADVDQWDDSSDAVTLMTLHSAKGLEFPAVLIAGLEDGLLPVLRPGDDGEWNEDDVEEERRLFYVGITRAKERLFMSFASQRRRYGRSGYTVRSRFLGEIPEPLLEVGFKISERPSDPGSNSRNTGSNSRRSTSYTSATSPSAPRRIKRPPAPARVKAAPSRADSPEADAVETPQLELGVPGGSEPSLEVGSWVQHPAWGRGQIKERSGGGGDLKLTIRFLEGSIKKVVAKYANLRSA
jgi:DNA helicase-2/ATP-dependent DNA helicase PcrA